MPGRPVLAAALWLSVALVPRPLAGAAQAAGTG